MKKTLRILFVSLAMAISAASGIIVSKVVKDVKKTNASNTLVNLPHMVSDFNQSTGHYWTKSTDFTPSASHISSSTEGYRQDSPSSIQTYTTDYSQSYIRAYYSLAGGYKDAHAIYVPFHMVVSVPAYCEYKLHLTFTVSANRQSTGGGADYSAELFSFDKASTINPGTFYYVPNNFAETTGDSYSVIRAAGETPHNGISVNPVSKEKLVTYTFSNTTNSATNQTLYFGLFTYVESSGTKTSEFEGRVAIKSATFDATYASYVCNGKNFMSDNFAGAWSEFNGGNNRTLELLANATASSDLLYNKSGGTLKLANHTLTMGSYIMYCRGSFTITATNSYGTITGTRDHSTLFLDGSNTCVVTLAGYATIENTAVSGNRAILIANENATLVVGSGNTVISSTYCIWVDAGTLRINGGYLRNTRTNYQAVYAGSSDTVKNIYVYGAATFTNATFSLDSLDSNVNVYAKYGDSSYTGSSSITILLRSTDTLALNQVGVRNVTESNYSKFLLVPSNLGYTFTKSGSNLVIGYKTQSVTYNLTNLTSNGAATCTMGSNLSFTISPNSGYALPTYITVRAGSTNLTQNTHYTYNSSTGAVVVYKENLINSITITASAVVQYTVTFMDSEGQAAEPIVVNGGKNIYFPESDNLPAYHHTTWYDNPEFTGSGHVVGGQVTISSDITYYAKYSQDANDHVEEFIGVELHFDVNVIAVSNTSDTGACRGDSGYYKLAEQVYTNFTNYQRETFCTKEGTRYADARARLAAWADANGDYLDLTTYQITKKSAKIGNTVSSSFNSIGTIIVSSIILISSIAFAVMVIRRKKHSIY
ncbi:MAG: hypothetical protein K6C32_03035 [Bacilli bacterium]|nr:hypothetical protein [Bacilli bacterium]